MRVEVELDPRGMLPDAYGKYAAPSDQRGRLCVRSFPLSVGDIPEGTKALALIFMDWDSIPVCGFPWIHWCAVLNGVEGAPRISLPDDASRQGFPGLEQGRTSAAKSDPEVATGYVGPCPPNGDHIYTLRVAALDEVPELASPFWANELVNAARGHVLATAAIELPSRS